MDTSNAIDVDQGLEWLLNNNKNHYLIKLMNYLLTYVNFIDQMIVNHDKHQDQCNIVLKSFVPKVVPQPWMPLQ